MKKIGFIDYYISEWHANNYPGWIKEAAGDKYAVAYVYAEKDISPIDGVSTREWCEKFGAKQCGSIEELCEASDIIVILAPSNPETHLGYAKAALPYGKPTYIDKTFAPGYAEAKEIFEIAEKFNTPFFSTSALRYADELSDYTLNAETIIATGSGSNADEYIIHLAEMVVKTMGIGAESIKVEKAADQYISTVKYSDGRSARMIYAPEIPYTATVAGKGGKSKTLNISSPFFASLIKDMVRFFEECTPSFNTQETLEVMKIRGAFVSAKDSGEEIKL